MKTISRRNLIKLSLAGTVSGMLNTTESWGEMAAMPTPREVEGPFYPVVDQRDKDADMTQVAGQNGLAKGQHIVISGSVKDTVGHPIENASIDIWQANAAGRYNHPRDPNPAPRDAYFQGWAIIHSDKNGEYRFKTVKPGAYPASETCVFPLLLGRNCANKIIVAPTTESDPMNNANPTIIKAHHARNCKLGRGKQGISKRSLCHLLTK